MSWPAFQRLEAQAVQTVARETKVERTAADADLLGSRVETSSATYLVALRAAPFVEPNAAPTANR